MTRTLIPTQTKDSLNFRFGQIFNYNNIKFAWRRQGYANKIVVGVVDDAIGKGFKIIDTSTKKPIKKNAQAWEIISTMWLDMKKSCYFDRAYGKSLGMFFTDKELEFNEEIPFWRAYDSKGYFAEYDEFARPTKYTVTNRVGGMKPTYKIREVVDKELDFTYEIIVREDDVKGNGISSLEAVWDTLFSLSTLDEQGTYYAIRYGAGIRYLKIPEAKFKDAAYMANIMKMLRGSLGVNGVYALPYANISGVSQPIDVASESATQINFLQLRDLILGTLSAQTGIPREVFLGSQLGLRSSEKNEDSYFDFLQSIQNDYRPFFKWVVNKLNEKFKWFGQKIIIDIEYITRDTMNKEEIVAITKTKVDVANSAGFNVPKEWLENQLDMPLEDKEPIIPPILPVIEEKP